MPQHGAMLCQHLQGMSLAEALWGEPQTKGLVTGIDELHTTEVAVEPLSHALCLTPCMWHLGCKSVQDMARKRVSMPMAGAYKTPCRQTVSCLFSTGGGVPWAVPSSAGQGMAQVGRGARQRERPSGRSRLGPWQYCGSLPAVPRAVYGGRRQGPGEVHPEEGHGRGEGHSGAGACFGGRELKAAWGHPQAECPVRGNFILVSCCFTDTCGYVSSRACPGCLCACCGRGGPAV